MSKLLETDISHLVTTRRFSHPANPTTMTLDAVPEEWLETFSRAKTRTDWDNILKVTERARPSVYFEARRQCAGRDSRSQRLFESRQRAADFLDSL
jgi:hypothetical protein